MNSRTFNVNQTATTALLPEPNAPIAGAAQQQQDNKPAYYRVGLATDCVRMAQ